MVIAVATKIVTPPSTDPVSLAEAKAHLNVDHADDDAMIAAMITAATQHAETFTGRAFIDQTWDLMLDAFPAGTIEVRKPPLLEVVSVVYDDNAGAEQTIDASTYVVDAISSPARLIPVSGSWPASTASTNGVRIRFRAGYLDTGVSPASANVPQAIKSAILMETAAFYMQRETFVIGPSVAQLPAWEALLRPHRVERGMA